MSWALLFTVVVLMLGSFLVSLLMTMADKEKEQ